MADFKPREHSILADLRLLKEARDFAERAAAEFGFGAAACYDVKLAMSEAVTNAIQHGSSSPSDPIKIGIAHVRQVVGRVPRDGGPGGRRHRLGQRFGIAQEGGALVFEVRDTGRFRPRVRRRGGELSESGRGLEFMRVLMDEVDLRPGDGGTLMRFAKRRS